MQIGRASAFGQTGRAGEEHHRRPFSIGAGNGIDGVETADAIGDADRSDPVDTGVRVCGKSGAVFARGSDVFDGRGFDQLIQREHIVAGYAEDMPDSEMM